MLLYIARNLVDDPEAVSVTEVEAILSEISLLADDIGIIDHGALLEEESLAELDKHKMPFYHPAQRTRVVRTTAYTLPVRSLPCRAAILPSSLKLGKDRWV